MCIATLLCMKLFKLAVSLKCEWYWNHEVVHSFQVKNVKVIVDDDRRGKDFWCKFSRNNWHRRTHGTLIQHVGINLCLTKTLNILFLSLPGHFFFVDSPFGIQLTEPYISFVTRFPRLAMAVVTILFMVRLIGGNRCKGRTLSWGGDLHTRTSH